jgi:hypothetical protein
MSQYRDQSYPNKRRYTNQNLNNRNSSFGNDNRNSLVGRPNEYQSNQRQLQHERRSNYGSVTTGNNNTNGNQRPWGTNGRNDPSPFTASIHHQAALMDPIPRRRQSINTEEGFVGISTIKAPTSQSNDPNRVPMVLDKDWN